ncbi:MAG TPA: FAD-dependent oxidoreductase [Ideonella sp.]|uniref:FAD-dependent oxidoreductase n=1 Tax=Ideonella sp. TaxID=1929293 RepID=UPI002CF84602|nr:FAD-dependent oxidoreductase [Ideonella sp.]HSI47092.1 FAD-dependent oxidoreductase [Ideonella sp.]
MHDIIVVGSGAAGLSAACTAAALGKRVLLLEHSDRIGGTTAISGGMVWIPDNHKMHQAGLPDSAAATREYLDQTVPGSSDDPRMQAFLSRGDEAIRFLEAHTSLRLQPVSRYPDYYADLPGATAGGRVLEPVSFDGRALGADFARLRDPLPEFLLFGGMMVSREDLPVLRRVGRSPQAQWHALKLLARFMLQRLQAHRGTSLVLGNALAARLFKSALDLGVDIATRTSVIGLIEADGRVAGVRTEFDGQRGESRASLGIILATGGLSHDSALRPRYVPGSAGTLSATVRSGAAHSGAALAAGTGAQLTPATSMIDDAQAFWVPVSRFRRSDGSTALFPHTVTDRAKPGLIAVNQTGCRFVNEAVSYHEFVRAQLRSADSAIPAWLICDSRFLWKYGLGRIRPFALSARAEQRSGYLHTAPTLEALATRIGVPPASLAETVRAFNVGAARGVDTAFGRGSTIYQRHLGDADQQPNPCVAPLERPPYHAVAVFPADLGMSAGVRTDPSGRALDEAGRAIEGLYACGNDMQSVMNGAYPGPGITLGPALVFGYLAARNACGAEAPASRPPAVAPAAAEKA